MSRFYSWLYNKLVNIGYLPDEAERKIEESKWIVEELNKYQMELFFNEENKNETNL